MVFREVVLLGGVGRGIRTLVMYLGIVGFIGWLRCLRDVAKGAAGRGT